MRLDNNRNLFLALIIGSLAALVMCAAVKAQATEIIPSVGLSRNVDSDDAKTNVGLALRASAIPSVVDVELKGQYRKEDLSGGAITEKQWPISASLWLTPLRVLYAGAGVGWYHTTLDYNGPAAPPDDTFQKFGVHAGGGFRVPFGSALALDLNGRYVWMEDQETASIPQKFNPDFWDMSLGLAFRFGGSHHED